MADVKTAFDTLVTLTITNANLTNSATAGWMSAVQDYTSTKMLDALVQVNLSAVNTAPANAKAIFIYAYGLVDGSGSNYTSSGDGTPSGSEGTITFPDYSTLAVVMPLIGVIPYPVQNKAISSKPFSIASGFKGILPPKAGICMINHSGMTLSVSSIQIRPVYATSV